VLDLPVTTRLAVHVLASQLRVLFPFHQACSRVDGRGSLFTMRDNIWLPPHSTIHASIWESIFSRLNKEANGMDCVVDCRENDGIDIVGALAHVGSVFLLLFVCDLVVVHRSTANRRRGPVVSPRRHAVVITRTIRALSHDWILFRS
jgi:hypothetical protein